jgi:Domain of unknown function (DU1801)
MSPKAMPATMRTKKPSTKPTPKSAAATEKQLTSFIAKFEPKHQALIRALRKILRQRMPTANELVYDNYNLFVIGFCSTERSSDCIVSIVGGASGIGLSFYWGATLPDPHGILQGGGNQNRFIRVESAATLARPEVKAVIAAAIAQGKIPLRATGPRKLIIRAIAPKQRPRRKVSPSS